MTQPKKNLQQPKQKLTLFQITGVFDVFQQTANGGNRIGANPPDAVFLFVPSMINIVFHQI